MNYCTQCSPSQRAPQRNGPKLAVQRWSATTMFRNTLIRTYLLGLVCIFMGAGLTDWSGSWVPLALGASACLMSTARTVKGILKRR